MLVFHCACTHIEHETFCEYYTEYWTNIEVTSLHNISFEERRHKLSRYIRTYIIELYFGRVERYNKFGWLKEHRAMSNHIRDFAKFILRVSDGLYTFLRCF